MTKAKQRANPTLSSEGGQKEWETIEAGKSRKKATASSYSNELSQVCRPAMASASRWAGLDADRHSVMEVYPAEQHAKVGPGGPNNWAGAWDDHPCDDL